MKLESILLKPNLLAYLVQVLHEKNPNKQIGKTIIQKMAYLLSRDGIFDFDFTMYHYGPYSAEVASELSFAEDIGLVEIKWADDKGFYITPKNPINENSIADDIKNKINEIVEKYWTYSAVELSIIATALYIKDNFPIEDDNKLVEIVASLKPTYDKNWIANLLTKAGI